MSAADAPGPPGQKGLPRRMAMAFVAKGFEIAVYVGQQFLMVPLFLHFWGPMLYRDWLTLVSTASFLFLVDAGQNYFYSNRMLLAWSRGDRDRFHRTLHFGLTAYLVVIGVALPLALLAAWLVPWSDAYKLADMGPGDAVAVMLVLVTHRLVNLPTGMLINIYRARGDQALGIGIGASQLAAVLAATATALAVGAGPLHLAGISILIACIAWVFILAHQRRRYTDIRYGLAIPSRAELRQTVTTAPFYALVPAATTLTFHGSILLLAALGPGGGAVVVFATLRTLTGIGRQLTEQLGQVAGIELARQFARGDDTALQRLFRFSGRLFGTLNGGAAGLIAIIGPSFLSIWTLGKVPLDYTVFWTFLCLHMLATPARAAESLLLHINRPRVLAFAHLGRGVAAVALCAALIPYYGPAGAAVAVTVAELGTVGVLAPWSARRDAGLAMLRPVAQAYFVTAGMFAASLAAAALAESVIGSDSLVRIVAVVALWATLLAVPAYYLLFEASQRNRLRRRLGIAAGK